MDDDIDGNISARQITERLETLLFRRHRTKTANGGGTHVFGLHVRSGAGFDQQDFDAVAMSTWPSKHHRIDIFELKATRSDWLRELKQPEKWHSAREFADRFWLVAAPGVAKREEIPDEWGWIEAIPNMTKLSTRKVAPALTDQPIGYGASLPPLPRGFVVALFQAEAHIAGKNPRARAAHRYEDDTPPITIPDDSMLDLFTIGDDDE